MERRLILAIVLSFLVILAWSRMQPKPPAGGFSPPSLPPPVQTNPESKTLSLGESTLLLFSLDIFKLSFSEENAAIREVIFPHYAEDKLVLQNAFSLAIPDWTFKKEKQNNNSITFLYQDNEKTVYKSLSILSSNYSSELEIRITNFSKEPLKLDLPVLLGTLNFHKEPAQTQYLDVVVSTVEKTLHFNGRKESVFPEAKFLALRNRYFCAIIEPNLNHFAAYIHKINSQESEVGLIIKSLQINPQQTWKEKFYIYLGPQDLSKINQMRPAWANIIYYGTFDPISQFLLTLLGFLQRLVKNWGGAIILLSLIIYFLLFPLTVKQMRSMKEMQVLQPRIEELKKLYKENPQKLNKEIMELYREHKVNPLGGCLPVVLQIPIFFALYQALVRTIALKGAQFLWIKDLSQPDRLLVLPIKLPFLGNAFNLLPILLAIGMFIQQKKTALASAAVSGEQQKMMLVLFPVMMGVIFYQMPAGLVLYWLTNSLLTLFYQLRMGKINSKNGTPVKY
jgi:YidC/Oxa1 family membrane protein insertase